MQTKISYSRNLGTEQIAMTAEEISTEEFATAGQQFVKDINDIIFTAFTLASERDAKERKWLVDTGIVTEEQLKAAYGLGETKKKK